MSGPERRKQNACACIVTSVVLPFGLTSTAIHAYDSKFYCFGIDSVGELDAEKVEVCFLVSSTGMHCRY